MLLLVKLFKTDDINMRHDHSYEAYAAKPLNPNTLVEKRRKVRQGMITMS